MRGGVVADQIKKLAKVGCTYDEISAIVGCSTADLEQNFAEVIAKGRAELKASLRKKQLVLALSGDQKALSQLIDQFLNHQKG